MRIIRRPRRRKRQKRRPSGKCHGTLTCTCSRSEERECYVIARESDKLEIDESLKGDPEGI